MNVFRWFRGTGKRRMPDALKAAERREATLNAAIDELQRENRELRQELTGARATATHLAKVYDEETTKHTATRSELAGAKAALAEAAAENAAQYAELVAWRADACNRNGVRLAGLGAVAVPQDLAETARDGIDLSGLQATYAAQQAKGGSTVLPATDPDGEDTVTFPSPLVPPNPVVHVADADPEATQPVVTLAGRLPGSTDPVAVPALVRAGALAGLVAGGGA